MLENELRMIFNELQAMSQRVGNKGAWLLMLEHELFGFPGVKVFKPICIPTSEFEERTDLTRKVLEMAHHLWPTEKLAMRSSPTHSMPGILKSYFDISGFEEMESTLLKFREDWENKTSALWRKKFCPDAKLAIIIQPMVNALGYGVCFSHDPSNGKCGINGKWSSKRAEIVSGKNGKDIAEMPMQARKTLDLLTERIVEIAGYPVDIEFGFDEQTVYLFQARPLVMTAEGKIRAIYDLYTGGKITKEDLKSRISSNDLEESTKILAVAKESTFKGVPVSSGVFTGKVSFGEGEGCLIIEELDNETDPLLIGKGAVLTSESSAYSHAGIRARKMKIPAIVEMEMKFSREGVILNGVLIREGETVTVDGTKGYLHIGEEKAIPLETTLQARELLEKILK